MNIPLRPNAHMASTPGERVTATPGRHSGSVGILRNQEPHRPEVPMIEGARQGRVAPARSVVLSPRFAKEPRPDSQDVVAEPSP